MASLLICSISNLGSKPLMNTIDIYLNELDAKLEMSQRHRRVILNEVREHLLDAATREISLGAPANIAEVNAVKAFGSVQQIAEGFNACEGAKATKQAPFITVVSGVLVFSACLAVAWSQPRNSSVASLFQQVTFFISVLAVQVALVSGLCGASRICSRWKSLESSGRDRVYVRRAMLISLRSLALGVVAISSNLLFDAIHNKNSNRMVIALSILVMISVAATGLLKLSRIKINSLFELEESAITPIPRVFTLGETIIGVIKVHPKVSLLCVATVAGLSAMNKAETNTLQQALPWGIAEVIATLLGFYLLGPVLNLRESHTDSAEII